MKSAWHNAKLPKLPRKLKKEWKKHDNKYEWLSWTILRRLIQGRVEDEIDKSKITIDHLREICDEMEGQTIQGLSSIHKREVGYW